MKKVNIIFILVVITFNILLLGNYSNYKNNKTQEQSIDNSNKEEVKKSMDKDKITVPTNTAISKSNELQVIDNNVKYNLSIESNSTPKQIEEMKTISKAIIALHNFSNGKEEAKNIKENFESGAINMFHPGMTFEELEKSTKSSKTVDNKLTIEKRNDAEYTVFYTYTINNEKHFDKYTINYATNKIRYKEHFYFRIG